MQARSSRLWLSALCAALFLAPSSHAAILRVNRDAPGPAHDGASWATAFTSFQAALDAAQAGDEVWVAGGAYSERFVLPAAVALYGGFAGTEAARGQRDPVANTTTLYGSTAGPIITVAANATAQTVVDGFTFQQGSRAIYASAPTELVISGNVFQDFKHTGTSYDDAAGGAVFLAGGRPTIAANAFRNNRTEYTYTDMYGETITAPGLGGAVYIAAGDPVITGNTFLNNRLAVGVLDGAARVTGNTFRRNDGGLFAFGAPVIRGNVFSGETGSPLRIRSTGATLVLINTIVGTQGALETAIFAWTESQGTLALHNNIVAFNGGKGIMLSGPAAAITVSNTCVFSNGQDFYELPVTPTGTLQADPLFADPPADLHLRPESPCRDAGNDAAVEAGDVDMDGQPRIQGAHVDIGADEQDGTAYPPISPVLYVSASGDDANSGRSWANAVRTAQRAIDLATVFGGTEAWFAAGTFGQAVLRDISLYGGFAEGETEREMRDPARNISILAGPSSGLNRSALSIPSTKPGIVVDGFTIQGGAGRAIYQGVFGPSRAPYHLYYLDGGGVYIEGGTPVLRNNVIRYNLVGSFSLPRESWDQYPSQMEPHAGGGIYVAGGSPTIEDNTITGNRTISGGGLFIADGSPTVRNNNFAGNRAEAGGGITVDKGTALVAGNLIAGNEAKGIYCYPYSGECLEYGDGGGILCSGTATPALINNTVVANTSVEAGGISMTAGTRVVNGIVAGNTGYGVRTSTLDIHNTDVFGNTKGNYLGIDLTGTNGNTSTDPLFVAGGYRLQEGSPCMDAGDDSWLSLLPVDLDGRPRRIGPHVDMGAFETPYLSLVGDALDALRAAAGLWDPAAGALSRLDVENGSSSGRVDLLDAIRLFRRAVGPGGA